MARLSQHDMRAILEFLRGAYSIHSLQDYGEYVTKSLGGLIGANYVSYNDVDLRRRHNIVIVDHPDAVVFPGYTDGIFDAHLSEHPAVAHFVATGDLAAVKMSDFLTQHQFHSLGLYQEFFRHVRTEHQLTAGVTVAEGQLIDIGLNRTRPDFSERDRLVLNVLRSHLADAYENVRYVAAVEADLELLLGGSESVEAGVVLLRPDGGIRLASAVARRLIQDYFGLAGTKTGQLPDEIARWVHSKEQHLSRHDAVAAPGDPLVVARDDRRLVICLVLGADRAVLVLREELLDLQPEVLKPLRLSHREAEVLAWVAKGKTDAEVAVIVGIRPRTVGKHLERIYQKLGVENRTAAAARAFEAASGARRRIGDSDRPSM